MLFVTFSNHAVNLKFISFYTKIIAKSATKAFKLENNNKSITGYLGLVASHCTSQRLQLCLSGKVHNNYRTEDDLKWSNDPHKQEYIRSETECRTACVLTHMHLCCLWMRRKRNELVDEVHLLFCCSTTCNTQHPPIHPLEFQRVLTNKNTDPEE